MSNQGTVQPNYNDDDVDYDDNDGVNDNSNDYYY